MWLLPTRNHLDNLKRFFKANREMGGSTPGLVLVNQSEWQERAAEYEALKQHMSPGWTYKVVPAESYGAALRAVWAEIKDLPWVGLVSDDLLPCTSTWDVQLIKATNGWNVVSSNDGWQAPARIHGAAVWSGDLLRAVGWLMPPGLKHIFHDDVWETLGRETGAWSVRMDILVKHLHEALTGIKGPAMDPTSLLWQHDEAVYRTWLAQEKDAAVARIKALMVSKGVHSLSPDFAGVNLMIGTPSHDGRYEGSYMTSLFQTLRFLTQNQVATCVAEEKYTADISLARAKIFAAFVRSTATHLLMIDADMGWSDDAIVRLFCARKDIVAVAGPKKRYPLQFAANYTDKNGDPIMLTFDPGSGTMEVGEVGCAFMLITKETALRLRDGYPDLRFLGVTGEEEWGVFNPIVENTRYYSEDFAFCRRWRDLGGTVHICPDVKLKHTGFHTFEGAFSETFPQMQQQEAAE